MYFIRGEVLDDKSPTSANLGNDRKQVEGRGEVLDDKSLTSTNLENDRKQVKGV